MTKRISLYFIESPIEQGEDEYIGYAFNANNWSTPVPSSPTGTMFLLPGRTIDNSKLSGTWAVTGSWIYTPAVYGITAGTSYELIIEYTYGINRLTPKLQILGV